MLLLLIHIYLKIKKNGEIVDDNTYRLRMAKKEHRKHVRDLLATAIVHKALDLEVGCFDNLVRSVSISNFLN